MGAPSHHVLVIDDEPFIGRMIAMTFEQGPFRVSTATDAASALATLRAHPDLALVLVDVNLLEGQSGLDVIEEAREDPAIARIPFIVVTATGQREHWDRARALGAASFITKPFSPRKLYHQVCALLGVPVGEEV